MALSNWDTLALNEKGESTNGVFTSPLGVTVEIYKNWLYVRDPKAWQEGGSYVHPVVMEVQKGSFHYKDVQIEAIRGPKNGIYCVVSCTRYQDQPKATPEDPKPAYVPPIVTAMVGIGCYGYGGEYGDEWIGIDDTEKDFLAGWLQGHATEQVTMFSSSYDPKTKEWVKGKEVMETVSHNFDKAIRDIPFGNALRFNQGDAYFAKNLDFELPATKPGEAQPTIMSQMLKSTEAEGE